MKKEMRMAIECDRSTSARVTASDGKRITRKRVAVKMAHIGKVALSDRDRHLNRYREDDPHRKSEVRDETHFSKKNWKKESWFVIFFRLFFPSCSKKEIHKNGLISHFTLSMSIILTVTHDYSSAVTVSLEMLIVLPLTLLEMSITVTLYMCRSYCR